MTDPVRFLRKAIFDALAGAFPVFDAFSIPSPTNDPYLVISTIQANRGIISDCGDDYRCVVTMNLYTKYSSRGGNLLSDTLSDTVLNSIDKDMAIDAFHITNLFLVNTNTSAAIVNENTLYKRQFVYQVDLSEV
jgi:hypothetical protein